MGGIDSTMLKVFSLIVAAFISVTLLAPGAEQLPGSSPAAAKMKWKRTVAPGVSYRLYRLPKPNKVRVVTFVPSSGPTLRPVLGSNLLPGFERTSSMARRSGAIAAINGDYARSTGHPVFTFARNGRLDQMPAIDPYSGGFEYGRNFSIDIHDEETYFGHPETTAWVSHSSPEGGAYEVHRVNGSRSRASADQLRAYTSAGGGTDRPPARGCFVRLRPYGSPQAADATTAPLNVNKKSIAPVGVESPHFVEKARCGPGRVYPKGGIVLHTPWDGRYADALRAMQPGEEVVFGWSLGWPDVFATIGGNPTLIEDGHVQHQSIDDGSSFTSHRHPRTAIAYNDDNGKLFLVTVDGRQPRYSRGMTLTTLTRFLRNRLGATDALNLDGGGSTTMVLGGKVKGRPSDGVERPVSSALAIVPRGVTTKSQGLSAAAPEVIEGAAEDAFTEMVEDPASVGGLSAYLDGHDYELPGFLERTADDFRATR